MDTDEEWKKWATMPEAPIECRNKERTSCSPSKASRCALGQEWDEDVCHKCPEWTANIIHDGFIDGYNSVPQEEIDEFQESLRKAGIIEQEGRK